MTAKPIITSQAQLDPYYDRYRRLLCRERPGLEERLRGGAARGLDGLSRVAEGYDVVLLDAFGVLNVGGVAVEGAPEAVRALLAAGKEVLVVSNNASQSPGRIARKFAAMGFPLGEERVVTSGLAVGYWLNGSEWRDRPYYLVGTDDSRDAYAPEPERLMVNHPNTGWGWREAQWVLLCSNRDYHGSGQEGEVAWLLGEGGCPVVVANPDLVAPDESGGVYAVAGYTAGQWADRFDVPLVGLGKPFAPIFREALARLPGVAPERVLMVGDTLDTDILGGAAMGFATCLTLSGVYRGQEGEVGALMGQRGIRPDWVLESLRW